MSTKHVTFLNFEQMKMKLELQKGQSLMKIGQTVDDIAEIGTWV